MMISTLMSLLIALIAGGAIPLSSSTATCRVKTGQAQLFVDDYLIDSQENLTRVLHQPKKDSGGNTPVIALTNEFGNFSTTHQANGSIVFDPKLKQFVMFAHGASFNFPRSEGWQKVRIYRYTSPDGMNWSSGKWVFPRSREDYRDPKTGKYASNLDLFSCYYDRTDSRYPYKGWGWYANWGDDLEGIHLLRSSDGVTWERGPMIVDGYSGRDKDQSHRRIEQDGRDMRGAGDVTIFSYDPIENRFLGIFKFFSKDFVENKNHLRARAYQFMDRMDVPFDIDRIDHVDLVPPAAEKNGDMPYDEYYASTAWRYEALWLGGLKIWHGEGDYPYSAAGSAYLKLVVSHDGLKWHKVQFLNDSGIPEVFIPNGPEGGNNGRNDGGYITEFSTGPLRIGDQLIYYYGCSSYGKNHPDNIRVSGGGIFRARLRVDGFVSVTGGTLVTKPLDFQGKNLTVNSTGSVQVTALSVEGRELGSAVVTGDSLRHQVRFGGKSLGQLARQKLVRLRFQLEHGSDLYSFAIR